MPPAWSHDDSQFAAHLQLINVQSGHCQHLGAEGDTELEGKASDRTGSYLCQNVMCKPGASRPGDRAAKCFDTRTGQELFQAAYATFIAFVNDKSQPLQERTSC